MDTTEAEELADAIARIDRWLDREHHCFPSHPLASSVARLLAHAQKSEAERDRLQAALDGAVEALQQIAKHPMGQRDAAGDGDTYILTGAESIAMRMYARQALSHLTPSKDEAGG
jgi:hypothetical protein